MVICYLLHFSLYFSLNFWHPQPSWSFSLLTATWQLIAVWLILIQTTPTHLSLIWGISFPIVLLITLLVSLFRRMNWKVTLWRWFFSTDTRFCDANTCLLFWPNDINSTKRTVNWLNYWALLSAIWLVLEMLQKAATCRKWLFLAM